MAAILRLMISFYSWQRVANPDTAAPYGETVLGMLAGYKDAIGNPDADGNTTTT